MNYRKLGKSGIKLSELSLGSWVNYVHQVDDRNVTEILDAAWNHGINFFDNAEVYANGGAERMMGRVFKALGWPREQYVVSTKVFWGGKTVNEIGLSMKHIIEGVNRSLRNFDLEYVDLVLAHRPDPEVPIEEVVWGFNQVLRQGKAFYWGTSEWPAESIIQAIEFARAEHLIPPVLEQTQYNILTRKRFEQEYDVLYKQYGYGTTTYSPLSSGLLSGKYNTGQIPEGSRPTLKGYEKLTGHFTDPVLLDIVRKFAPIADDLGISLAQLSIAWLLKRPNVSSVILGASNVNQLNENMKALDAVPLLTDEVMARIEDAMAGYKEA